MRNVLLLGASALALSLTAVGAYAQQQGLPRATFTDQPGYTEYAPQSQEVYQPRAVLGAHEVYNQTVYTYPDHEDARSVGR